MAEEKPITVSAALIEIQSELKTPKSQFNKFGNYAYRSCEDILEAVKPLLKKHGCFIILTDEIWNVGNKNYVKATAKIQDAGGRSIETIAYAREPEEQKGMNDSQITGAASSYARKYALSGLLAIDDTKDADAATKTKKNPVEVITEAQMKQIAPYLEKILALPTVEASNVFKEEMKGKVKEFTAEQANMLRSAFDNKVKELSKKA